MFDIFEYSKTFLGYTNPIAHNSTQKNIVQKLFPNLQSDLGKFFNDEILNSTKDIIKGMKSYYVNGKKNSAFKIKMNKVKEMIDANLKILNKSF